MSLRPIAAPAVASPAVRGDDALDGARRVLIYGDRIRQDDARRTTQPRHLAALVFRRRVDLGAGLGRGADRRTAPEDRRHLRAAGVGPGHCLREMARSSPFPSPAHRGPGLSQVGVPTSPPSAHDRPLVAPDAHLQRQHRIAEERPVAEVDHPLALPFVPTQARPHPAMGGRRRSPEGPPADQPSGCREVVGSVGGKQRFATLAASTRRALPPTSLGRGRKWVVSARKEGNLLTGVYGWCDLEVSRDNPT